MSQISSLELEEFNVQFINPSKILDDIKESIKNMGFRLVKTIDGLTIFEKIGVL